MHSQYYLCHDQCVAILDMYMCKLNSIVVNIEKGE